MLTQNKDKYLIFKMIGITLCLITVSRCSYVAGQNSIRFENSNSTVQQKITAPNDPSSTEKQSADPIKPIIQSITLDENKHTATSVAPTKSNWGWHYDVDAMTSNTRNFAFNYSTNKLSFGSPYQGEQRGSLMVRHQSDEGSSVMISIEKGQILCTDSYKSCKIKVRFDQNAPEEFDAAGSSDSSSEMIFIVDTKKFLEKLEKSEKLLVQLTVFHEGSPVLEFNTKGFSFESLIKTK